MWLDHCGSVVVLSELEVGDVAVAVERQIALTVLCMPISAGSLAVTISVVAGVMLIGSVASVSVAIEDIFFGTFYFLSQA